MNIENFNIRPVCAEKQLELSNIACKLLKEYIGKNEDIQGLYAVCINMAMCYLCCYKGDKKAFKNPIEVGKKLSLDEIATICEKVRFSKNEYDECSVNENFGEVINND